MSGKQLNTIRRWHNARVSARAATAVIALRQITIKQHMSCLYACV